MTNPVNYEIGSEPHARSSGLLYGQISTDVRRDTYHYVAWSNEVRQHVRVTLLRRFMIIGFNATRPSTD